MLYFIYTFFISKINNHQISTSFIFLIFIADPVPLQIRNAPTRLMKELNYGKGYQYAHDFEDKITSMQCLPNNIKDHRYYFPTNQGTEAKVIKRMEQIAYLRKYLFLLQIHLQQSLNI